MKGRAEQGSIKQEIRKKSNKNKSPTGPGDDSDKDRQAGNTLVRNVIKKGRKWVQERFSQTDSRGKVSRRSDG